MGMAYCFLNSLRSPIILCSDSFFRILLFLLPAQHLILQFQKWNLFIFKWIISFSLIRIWQFLSLTVSDLDKIASFIVSDIKHVQECKYVCSWQLGLVFLAGKVWKGDFLDRITLVVSSWNVCLQEQKAGEWHAVTCLVNNQSFTEQYTTDWITRNHKENKQGEAKSNQLCDKKSFV